MTVEVELFAGMQNSTLVNTTIDNCDVRQEYHGSKQTPNWAPVKDAPKGQVKVSILRNAHNVKADGLKANNAQIMQVWNGQCVKDGEKQKIVTSSAEGTTVYDRTGVHTLGAKPADKFGTSASTHVDAKQQEAQFVTCSSSTAGRQVAGESATRSGRKLGLFSRSK